MNTPTSIHFSDAHYVEIETKIQALIDGGLDNQSQQELLLSFDSDHPEYWRYATLGFVEQQILTQALKGQAKTTTKNPILRYWALAACVVLSLMSGGWWMGKQSTSSSASDSVVAMQDKNTQEPPLPSVLDLHPKKDGSSPFSMKLPIYDATKNENAALTQIDESARSLRKAQDLLQQQGYATSTNTQYITANLKDGNRLVVPVNHIFFQPNQKSTNTQQPEL